MSIFHVSVMLCKNYQTDNYCLIIIIIIIIIIITVYQALSLKQIPAILPTPKTHIQTVK